MDEERRVVGWIALQLVKGLGPGAMTRLVSRLGGIEQVFSTTPSAFDKLDWLRPGVRAALASGPPWGEAEAVYTRVKEMGGWVVSMDSSEYPGTLLQSHSPPPLLYGLGDWRVLDSMPSVAVVGSRKASSYGLSAARAMAGGLAQVGLTVVSGLAVGIDAAAHAACLAKGGSTVAVLGCGLDVDYPKKNVALKARIAETGAVISEFPPGTRPDPGNFPRRNRIISALARGVVVVEAGMRSGSLITAAHALDQGREVMAMPGSVFSARSRGTHWLIKQGANLVEGPDDVCQVLGHGLEENGSISQPTLFRPDGLTEEERRILGCVEAYPRHMDEIAACSGLGIAKTSGLLLQMELKELVQALPGKMYILKEQA